MNRREMLKLAASATAVALATPMVNRGRFRLFANSQAAYSTRAVDLVKQSTVIDMLSPFAISFAKHTKWMSNPASFTSADAQRFKDSGINVFHIGVGLGGRESYLNALKYFAAWNGFIAHHDQLLMRVDTPGKIDQAKTSGKVGVLLGLQNSEHFQTAADVDYFYNLGQRVSQLTYNARNMIGNGSTERRDEGLSDFGVSIVERMNRVGMAVDVSHCGDRTTLDAFEASKKPVLITHSNCRALVPNHPRCKTDEAIKKMAASGGVMGITGVRMFVRDREPTTIEHALDHFDHVKKLVGVEHLGVGSDVDLDGYDDLPEGEHKAMRSGYKGTYAFREKDDIEGLDHPKRMFDLAEGLLRRKYADREIEMILGGNFKRVLSQIWSV
ncbi:MAG TPA: membrane dipeptidase [Blastocatellia bacterium]|nr:membrane dipeptidase [Blastocatellia bacterium]